MAKKRSKTVNKSASTGRFVKNSTVKRHGSTTVKQKVRTSKKKK